MAPAQIGIALSLLSLCLGGTASGEWRPPRPANHADPTLTRLVADATPSLNAPEIRRFEQTVRRIRNKHLRANFAEHVRRSGWDAVSAMLGSMPEGNGLERLLWTVFERDDELIRRELLEILNTQGSNASQRIVMEQAIGAREDALRDAALTLVEARSSAGELSDAAQLIVHGALLSEDTGTSNRAALIADRASILGVIPTMVQAQTGVTVRNRGRSNSVLAFIAIGTQQSFVAGLTPVVSNGAVGFAPTIGVQTEGTVLSVGDAVVVSYRTEVNRRLIRLTSRVSGVDTSSLAYDSNAWATWYHESLLPWLIENDKDPGLLPGVNLDVDAGLAAGGAAPVPAPSAYRPIYRPVAPIRTVTARWGQTTTGFYNGLIFSTRSFTDPIVIRQPGGSVIVTFPGGGACHSGPVYAGVYEGGLYTGEPFPQFVHGTPSRHGNPAPLSHGNPAPLSHGNPAKLKHTNPLDAD